MKLFAILCLVVALSGCAEAKKIYGKITAPDAPEQPKDAQK